MDEGEITRLPKTEPAAREDLATRIETVIIALRGERVILDADLARLYEVPTKRLNEQVKRNRDRFPSRYAFPLTGEEFQALRSHDATSKGRGGRRHVPWAFTEHGVVMVATILSSARAIEVSQLVVDVFIEVRRRVEGRPGTSLSLDPAAVADAPSLGRLSALGDGLGQRLRHALNLVLDSMLDTKRQATVREEAQNVIHESIQAIKERLKKQGLENDEIAARVNKLLAEAEKERAIASKTHAEAEELRLGVTIKKLRLLMEVNRAIEQDRLEDLLGVLREMGGSP